METCEIKITQEQRGYINVTPDISPGSLTWHHSQVDEVMGLLLDFVFAIKVHKQAAVFALVLVLDVLQEDGELFTGDVLHSQRVVGVTGPTRMFALVAAIL